MITSLSEAVLNVGSGIDNKHCTPAQKKILYSSWGTRYAKTIQAFYNDFLADRLPDPHIVLQWHRLLVAYSERPGAIFPVRVGNVKKRLRRGWLVKVDDDFSYMFTDNDLATYIYKMALDGYCPEEQAFFEFMTVFKAPSSIEWLSDKKATIRNKTHNGCERHFISMPVHFNPIGGKTYPDNTEDEKNAYINYSPAPTCCLGRYGYKHAHLVDVNKADYEGCRPWLDIRDGMLGEESTLQKDYQWDPDIQNFVWKRTDLSDAQKTELKELLTAHLLRFLDPMNHFLSPKSGNNQYVKADGSEDNDVAEYANLQKYIIAQKAHIFKEAYSDFLIRARAPMSLRGIQDASLGDEEIRIHYYKTATHTPKKAAKPLSTKASAGTTRAASGENQKTVFDIFKDIIRKNKMTPTLLADLQTLPFASKQFGVSGYPILVEASSADAHPNYNKKKYYQTEKLTINSTTYYVCSQWTPNARLIRLQNWHKTL